MVTIKSISKVVERTIAKYSLSGLATLIPCVKMVSLLKNSMKELHFKGGKLMPKKKDKVITSIDLEVRLMSDYSRWKHIFEFGCSDPSWCDGVNINLVRNHILYAKKRVEEVLKDNYIAYPDSYFYPDPVELPNDFMAVDRKPACMGKFLTANKNLCYSEAIQFTKFDWKEALCV